jgi:hypothetical protein
MRQSDRLDVTTVDCFNNWRSIVGGVNHNHFAIITDQPNVVGYFPFATIKRENSSGVY